MKSGIQPSITFLLNIYLETPEELSIEATLYSDVVPIKRPYPAYKAPAGMTARAGLSFQIMRTQRATVFDSLQ